MIISPGNFPPLRLLLLMLLLQPGRALPGCRRPSRCDQRCPTSSSRNPFFLYLTTSVQPSSPLIFTAPASKTLPLPRSSQIPPWGLLLLLLLLLLRLHQYQVCRTLVCCAGMDLYGSHLHPRLHSHSSSSGFELRFSKRCSSVGRNRVHAQAQGDLDTKSSSRAAHSWVASIRSQAYGNHACAAARPFSQVWGSPRCAAACGNAISCRTEGERRGRAFLTWPRRLTQKSF